MTTTMPAGPRSVEEKRAGPGDDVPSLLVSVRDEEGLGLADQEIFEQPITFVIAGHETTATALSWAMYELHRAPETLARLRSELDGAEASPEALAKLPYLGAVIAETLRMHPPLPVVQRKTLTDFTLSEHQLARVGTYGPEHGVRMTRLGSGRR